MSLQISLRNRLRAAIRSYLGLEALWEEVAAIQSCQPSLAMFRAMEQKQAERHAALSGLLNQTNEAVRKLEAALQRANAFTPAQYPDSPLPWELIEAMALEKLEQPPDPKEFQNA